MQRKPKIKSDNLEDFINGAKDQNPKVNQQPNQQLIPQKEEIDLDKLRRQTYYITELYIQAIEQMAFYEKMDKSEIIRKSLDQFVPTKYLNLAIKK